MNIKSKLAAKSIDMVSSLNDVTNPLSSALSLNTFQLFSYNAFNQSGPIFIQKTDVEPYSAVFNFPSERKADKENFPLTLIGYNGEQHMVYTKLVGDDDVDALIDKIFETEHKIAFLHASNAEASCFICKIERV